MKEYKLRVDQYRVFFFGFDFSEFGEFDNEVMNVLRKMKEIFYFFEGKKMKEMKMKLNEKFV